MVIIVQPWEPIFLDKVVMGLTFLLDLVNWAQYCLPNEMCYSHPKYLTLQSIPLLCYLRRQVGRVWERVLCFSQLRILPLEKEVEVVWGRALIFSVKEHMWMNYLNFKWSSSDFFFLFKVPNRISVMTLCFIFLIELKWQRNNMLFLIQEKNKVFFLWELSF